MEKHFEKAIELYTQAIETLGVDKKECAPYLCNRAKCNIILDKFGAAMQDADMSIAADPTF